jgi:hypothetical protein
MVPDGVLASAKGSSFNGNTVNVARLLGNRVPKCFSLRTRPRFSFSLNPPSRLARDLRRYHFLFETVLWTLTAFRPATSEVMSCS